MEFHAISLGKRPEENSELLEVLSNPENLVFEEKLEALSQMKKWKSCQPRLKTFDSREKALACASTIEPEENLNEISIVNSANGGPQPPQEGCPYKGLTPQELKQIKEAVENSDEFRLKSLVESNPRYLMTPCDQPSIIHSGTRSNALHIAARK